MHKILADILTLQDFDRRFKEVEKQLSTIPLERRSVEAKVAEANSAVVAVDQEILRAEKKRKDEEAELKKADDELLKKRILMASAKKEEEFRAIESEINALNASIEKRANSALELLYSIDEIRKRRDTAQKALAATNKTAEGELSILNLREAEMTKTLSAISNEIAGLSICKCGSYYEAYSVLKGINKPFPLVVELLDEKCPCCNLRLSRETIDATKDCSNPVFCENCGRILYKRCG